MAMPMGCEYLVGSLTPSVKQGFRVTNRRQDGKDALYGLAFNFLNSRYFNTFAAAIGNSVTVYECLSGGVIALLQSYIDEDKDESFYTVSWACKTDGTVLLVAGGKNGVIRVIDTSNEKIHKSLVGHGMFINEIKTQACKPSLVVSVSKDRSVRLWNADTGICILIFAGTGGHRKEVLSVDFHPSDEHRIVSCAEDKTVIIWSIKEFWEHVEKSFTWTDLPSKFQTKIVQFPIFTSRVCPSYFSCNQWIGRLILSKGIDNELVLWDPKPKNQPQLQGKAKIPTKSFLGTADILQKYPVPDSRHKYFKFSCDLACKAAAIGNLKGNIYVWDIQASPPVLITRLSHPQSKSPIKHTAMSVDGSTIIAYSDKGTLWRWDKI